MSNLKKKVAVITTGGTIAMNEDTVTKTVRPVPENHLASIVPYLTPFADIEMNDFLNLPSPHMMPHHMFELANEIHKYVKNDEYAGVVVTHGTDTLEETAYVLDLIIDTRKPIVVTGAMRSHNEIGSDGPFNLISSVRVASSEVAIGKGVIIVK